MRGGEAKERAQAREKMGWAEHRSGRREERAGEEMGERGERGWGQRWEGVGGGGEVRGCRGRGEMGQSQGRGWEKGSGKWRWGGAE